MSKYVCTICGYVYDEAKGIPEKGIAPGTVWESLPDDWKCPLCGAPKAMFKPLEENAEQSVKNKEKIIKKKSAAGGKVKESEEKLRELSDAELSILCANLAKGCEKQYLPEEQQLFGKLAAYFEGRVSKADEADFREIRELINIDNSSLHPKAFAAAEADGDRGALRALTWAGKTAAIAGALIDRYLSEGADFIKGSKIFVCEICGFIYIGDDAPEVCPVCKVPKLKITEIGRA